MNLCIVFLVLVSSVALCSADTLPDQFPSQTVAEEAGCRFAAVKGPAATACVTTAFGGQELSIGIYESQPSGAIIRTEMMRITSWYWAAKVSFRDIMQSGTDWLVVETEGNRGTGVRQTVLVVIGWDGDQWSTLVVESLTYNVWRPNGPEDVGLAVTYAFQTSPRGPVLRLKYSLRRGTRPAARWEERLHWNRRRHAFLSQTSTRVSGSSLPGQIRAKIGRVRRYFLGHRPDPKDISVDWFGQSGLMNILDPALPAGW